MTDPRLSERQIYRRRRLIDAARLLPVLGTALLIIPAFIVPPDGVPTATRLIYFILCWVGLIAASVILSRRLGRGDPAARDP